MDYEIMMNGIVKIGQYAPEFEATSSNGKISLSDYKGKWVVLFSHPGDLSHNSKRPTSICQSFLRLKYIFNIYII